jgi:hypothetical protein
MNDPWSVISSLHLEDRDPATILDLDGFSLYLIDRYMSSPYVSVRFIRKIRRALRRLERWADPPKSTGAGYLYHMEIRVRL